MTGETKASVSGWTIDTLAAHHDAIRQAQEKFDTERDRRYTEVGVEREKALKIKETADLAALGLAREIQSYKDEKANQLREQINSERGLYASQNDLQAAVEKIEDTIKPLATFVASQQGRSTGTDKTWGYIFAALGAAFGLFGILVAVAVMFRDSSTAQPSTVSTPQIIYVPAPVTEPKGATK